MFTVSELVPENFESITDVSGGLGTSWECIFNIRGRQTDFLAFNFEYIKDASASVTIESAFEM